MLSYVTHRNHDFKNVILHWDTLYLLDKQTNWPEAPKPFNINK